MRAFFSLAAFFWFLVVSLSASVMAHEVAGPKGAVILTITGNIHHTNRSETEPFEDAFFNHHNRRFNQAYVFDLTMLSKLKQVEIIANAEGWQKPVKLKGPRLEDVLTKAGALGRTYRFMALDGYVAEISLDDLGGHNWVLALEANGKPLGLGGRGPLWLAYETKNTKANPDQESKWVWSIFLIEVE